MITDEQLMVQAGKGDMTCVAQLFERHHTSLYNFFYGQTKDDALSKDLVQNLFERMIKYRSKYTAQYPFKPWMYKMAWNLQNDHYRKKRFVLPGADQINHLLPQTEETNMDPKENQKRQLKKALEMLKQEHRQVLHLAQFEGLKYAEISEVLGCSLSATKVRAHRAMKALRIAYKSIEA